MPNYKVPPFIKRSGDALLYNGDGEFIFYVPEIYFERKGAEVIGEYVRLVGVMDYSIFKPNGSNIGLKRFDFPTVFLTKPCEIEKKKQIKLKSHMQPDDFRLLHYKQDDVIVVNVHVPQEIQNVEDFYTIFTTGHLPVTIPYDKMQDYFEESMNLNGGSYGLSLQMFGVIISEMCRSATNLDVPFRLSHDTNMTNYRSLNIRDVPKYISAYSSITSENWDNAVTGALTSTKVSNSPMEKLLMGEAADINTDDVNIEKTKNQYSIKMNGKIVSKLRHYDYHIKDFNWVLVSDVDTDPDYRKKGLASRLIDELYSDITKDDPNKGLYVLVTKDNEKGINLYTKTGFKKVRSYKIKNNSGNDGDYFIMAKGKGDMRKFNTMTFS